MKTCKKCGNEKSLDEYNTCPKSKGGYRAACKDCTKLQQSTYRKNNRDKELAYKREYNAKNREEINRKNREYANRHKEALAEYGRKWAAENRDLRNAREQRRRSRKAQVADDFTLEQWLNSVAHFENSCAYCGKHGALQQEHVIPVASGGGYTVTNIVPACPTCNQSKNARDMKEWFTNQPFFDKHSLDKITLYLEGVS